MKIQTLLYLLKFSWLQNDQETQNSSSQLSIQRGTVYEDKNLNKGMEVLGYPAVKKIEPLGGHFDIRNVIVKTYKTKKNQEVYPTKEPLTPKETFAPSKTFKFIKIENGSLNDINNNFRSYSNKKQLMFDKLLDVGDTTEKMVDIDLKRSVRKADNVRWKISHESFIRNTEKNGDNFIKNDFKPSYDYVEEISHNNRKPSYDYVDEISHNNDPKPPNDYVEEISYNNPKPPYNFAKGISNNNRQSTYDYIEDNNHDAQRHKNDDNQLNERINLMPESDEIKYQNYKRTIPKSELDTLTYPTTTEDANTILKQIYTLNSDKNYLNRRFYLTTDNPQPNSDEELEEIDSEESIPGVTSSTTHEATFKTESNQKKNLDKNVKALGTMTNLVQELLQLISAQNKTQPFLSNRKKKQPQKRAISHKIFRKPRNPIQEYWSRTRAVGLHYINNKQSSASLTKEEAMESSKENIPHPNIEKRSAKNISADHNYRVQKMMADLHAIIRLKRNRKSVHKRAVYEQVTYKEPCTDSHLYTSKTRKGEEIQAYESITHPYAARDTRYGTWKPQSIIIFAPNSFSRIKPRETNNEHFQLNENHELQNSKIFASERRFGVNELHGKKSYKNTETKIRKRRSLRKKKENKSRLLSPRANVNWLTEFNRKLRRAESEDLASSRSKRSEESEKVAEDKTYLLTSEPVSERRKNGYNPPEFFRPEALQELGDTNMGKTNADDNFWYNHEFADIKNPAMVKPYNVTRDILYEYYM